MSERAARPLNSKAVAAADAEIYAKHAKDPRPNALYDADGKRLPLDETDPDQAGLRKEWMDSYSKNKGKLEKKPVEPPKPVDGIEEICEIELASLTVKVSYSPYPSPVVEATVELIGPSPRKGSTDRYGRVVFDDLQPGGYEINVTYEKKNAMVDQALPHVKSVDWAVSAKRTPYPRGANKCNLFIYEMGNASGFSVPKRERFSISQWETVWYPPLAGEWANDSATIGGWSMISEADAAPGDIVAEAVNYADATGHVGLISYPVPNGMSMQLAPGQKAFAPVSLERRVISAGSDEILNNDYFWSPRRHGVPHYKRFKK